MKSPAAIEIPEKIPPKRQELAPLRNPPRCFLLGLPFDRLNLDEVADDCVRVMKEGRPRYLSTPNVDFTRCAALSPGLSEFLMGSWRNTCDGLPLVWFSHLLGTPLPERVAGSDLTPRLLERCAREGLGVFFLGSDADTLREAAEKLEVDHPGIDVRGWHAPPYGPVSDWDHATILAKLGEARPDLVLVATGSPKQEEWISRYQKAAGIPLCIGVGASLDFVTGKQVRAPRWVQRIGMEWFWRMSRSPKRLAGRYAADFGFFFRVAFHQWRLHRFWKTPDSILPAPASDRWEVIDVDRWLKSASGNTGFPDGPVLLQTGRMEAFGHESFNRFAEAVMRHRLQGFDCALWNPAPLLDRVIKSFGWQTFLPCLSNESAVGEFFGGLWEGESDSFMPSSGRIKVLLSAGMIQGGRSGVGRYVIELVRRLASGESRVELHIAGLKSDRELFLEVPDDRWVEIPDWAASGALNFLWHQTALRSRIRRRGFSLVHIPSYRRILWRCPIPQVATIHDCAPFELRDKYGALRGWFGRQLVPSLARKCDGIISVSQCSAEAIVKYLGVERERVSTIPNGIGHRLYYPRPAADIESFLAGQGERAGGYFLYVARLEHSGKNHFRLIEAFEQFKQRNPESPVRLVFAGADWQGASEIHARIRKSSVHESIRCLGFVPDEDLPLWYGGACTMVMPTLFEGFGLPVIEALACGTLVACSDLPVLREVADRAAVYFDAHDPGAIRRCLEDCTSLSSPEKSARIERGRRRAAAFDWDTVGQAVLNFYKNHQETTGKYIFPN